MVDSNCCDNVPVALLTNDGSPGKIIICYCTVITVTVKSFLASSCETKADRAYHAPKQKKVIQRKRSQTHTRRISLVKTQEIVSPVLPSRRASFFTSIVVLPSNYFINITVPNY